MKDIFHLEIVAVHRKDNLKLYHACGKNEMKKKWYIPILYARFEKCGDLKVPRTKYVSSMN